MKYKELLAGFLLLFMAVNAFDKGDYLQLVENTDYCLVDCYSVYRVCALDAPTTTDALQFNFSRQDFGNYSLLTNYSGTWGKVAKASLWGKGLCYYIKIAGQKLPFESIDNVPTWAGYSYPEYAWWNASYSNCVNYTTLEPLARLNTLTNLQVNCSGDASCQWGRLVNASCSIGGTQMGAIISNVSSDGSLINITFVDSNASTVSWYYGNLTAYGKTPPPNGLLFDDEFNESFNASGQYGESNCTGFTQSNGILNFTCKANTQFGLMLKGYSSRNTTIEARFQTNNSAAGNTIIGHKVDGTTFYDVLAQYNGNILRLRNSNGVATSDSDFSNTLSNLTWVNYAMASNGSGAIWGFQNAVATNALSTLTYSTEGGNYSMGGSILDFPLWNAFDYYRIWNSSFVNYSQSRNFNPTSPVYATAWDEETGDRLFFNITFTNSIGATNSSTNQFLFSTTAANLPAGTNTIVVKNYSGGYPQRTYYADLSNGLNLTAQLLKTTSGQTVRIHVQNTLGGPIQGAIVTISKQSPSVLIEQATTDSTGTATLFLSPSTNYVILITASGYLNTSAALTPSGTDYTFSLSSGAVNLPVFVFEGVTYSLYPDLLSMNTTINPVIFQVTANQTLSSYGMNISYQGNWLYNQTNTDASGGTIQVNLNNSGRSGNLTVVIFIQKTGFNLWVKNQTYFIYQTTAYNNTFSDSWHDLAEALKFSPQFGAPLILLIVVGFTSAWMARFSIIGGGLMALILLGAAMLINQNWFPAWAWFVIALAVFALAVLRFRENG